jgi:hypothetical protein
LVPVARACLSFVWTPARARKKRGLKIFNIELREEDARYFLLATMMLAPEELDDHVQISNGFLGSLMNAGTFDTILPAIGVARPQHAEGVVA